MNTATRIGLLMAPAFILFSGMSFGQKSTAAEALYRCRDANGQMRFGSAMPVECTGRDTEVLSSRGNVLRIIEGAGTRAKRLEEEAVAAQVQKGREEQALRDRVLIDTYLTVADIERLRDQRLDLVEAQLKVSEQHIATLHDRISRLRQQSARFKPYAEVPNAPPLPDHLAEEIINTVKSIGVDRQTIDIKRNEQETMTANFARDINRFKELKGLK
ncbi:MAG: DUF4124 domain-containing protein [Candidatus Obscuribacterales bacterium]|nr:DUF4124 domain-containing protein [Steroidobacteraceae bacterium]